MRTDKLIAGVTAAAISLVTMLIIGTPVAAAASYGGIGLAPVAAGTTTPLPESYFTQTVAAGSIWSARVMVTNSTNSPEPLVVNPVDGVTASSSGAVYASRRTPLRGSASWVRPAVSSLIVPAHDRSFVDFSVAVPSSARPGDHLAGIAFQMEPQTSPSTRKFRVRVVTRAVIGVLVIVPGPASFNVRLGAVALRGQPGTGLGEVVIDLVDSGGLLGRPDLAVSVSRGVVTHLTVRRTLGTLLPGDEIPYPMPWPVTLTPGRYHIRVCASGVGMTKPTCESSTYSLGQVLKAPRSDLPAQPASSRSSPLWALVLAAIAVLLCAIAVLVVHQRRSSRAVRAKIAALEEAARQRNSE